MDAAETALADAKQHASAANKAWEEHQAKNVATDVQLCEDVDNASLSTPDIAATCGNTPSDVSVPPSCETTTAESSVVAVVIAPDELLQAKQEADDALQEATRVHELTTKAAQMTLWQRICTLLQTLEVWLLLWNGLLQGFGLGMVRRSTPQTPVANSTCGCTHSIRAFSSLRCSKWVATKR